MMSMASFASTSTPSSYAPQEGWKIIELYYTKSGTGAYTKDFNGEIIYHLRSQLLKATVSRAKIPEFQIHLKDKNGPVVAASRSNMLATKLEVCFTDPTISNASWQQVQDLGEFTTHCTWTEPNTLKTYSWKQTGRKEVKQKGGHTWDDANLKLVDTESNEIVGWYINYVTGIRKMGKFEFKEDPELGVEWERGVILTAMALITKDRGVGFVEDTVDAIVSAFTLF